MYILHSDCAICFMLLPFQGVGVYYAYTQGVALGYVLIGLSARVACIGFQPVLLVLFYFTSITRYLLVDQNICGLLMRSTYCLLASCSRVYELDGCMVRILADLE